jgi:lysine 6-dehydrogenase
MGVRYLLLGAGRQGIAAAYDLARFGNAEHITVGDVDAAAATQGAARLNELLGRPLASQLTLDVRDDNALRGALAGAQACVSSIHYAYNLAITRAAIDARVHLTDLGGNTDVVRRQLALDADARAAGVTVVPHCGMGPGLNLSRAMYVMELVDTPHDVRIWDGGLPQDPEPPWNYASTFNIAGLTNEYAGTATFIRDGKLTPVACFDDIEPIEFAGIGKLEAFVTSGGLSTAPWTLVGKLRRLENKTIRYPGHAQLFKGFIQLGLLETEPIDAGGVKVAPRDVLHALLEPRIRKQEPVRDVCIMRVRCDGIKNGKPAAAVVELIDYYDEQTGFTAMQRLTGWHASIMLIAAVEGRIRRGAVSVENALSGSAVVEDCRKRGFEISTKVE